MILVSGCDGRRLPPWLVTAIAVLVAIEAWRHALVQIREIQFHAETAARIRQLQNAMEQIGDKAKGQ